MASSDEDFVEMLSHMLMLGKCRYEELIGTTSEEAQAVFRSKEQHVVNYFKEVWDIDFYSLQTRVNSALNALVPVAADCRCVWCGQKIHYCECRLQQPGPVAATCKFFNYVPGCCC